MDAFLSDFVSADGGNPVPDVNDLNGTLTYELNTRDLLEQAALPVELTFTFANDAVLVPYEVAEIFFNIPDNVDSVSLTSNPGGKWMASFDNLPGGGFAPNGFGSFDLLLTDGPGNGRAKIKAGRSATFGLMLSGTGTINLAGFLSELSEQVQPGDLAMTAGARFRKGPAGESGFGATNIVVPEPATLALIAIGGVFLLRTRRRKSSSNS